MTSWMGMVWSGWRVENVGTDPGIPEWVGILNLICHGMLQSHSCLALGLSRDEESQLQVELSWMPWQGLEENLQGEHP